MGNSVKKITLLLVIIFTFLFSTTSWGEWSYVGDSIKGKYYYDKDRVRKSGKYLYFWELGDYHKPLGTGFLSSTSYQELDCSIFRYKVLRVNFFTKSMGKGETIGELTPADEWKYPKPQSATEVMLNKICKEHQ